MKQEQELFDVQENFERALALAREGRVAEGWRFSRGLPGRLSTSGWILLAGALAGLGVIFVRSGASVREPEMLREEKARWLRRRTS